MSSDVKHDYHLVDPSPWPVVGSVFAFIMMVGAVFFGLLMAIAMKVAPSSLAGALNCDCTT